MNVHLSFPDMIVARCCPSTMVHLKFDGLGTIYDQGKTTYIHSSHDFTSGNVGLNPGQARFFNILFGPAQGYGNYVDFKYDQSKEYFLKIDEPFGSAQIPLDLVSKTTN